MSAGTRAISAMNTGTASDTATPYIESMGLFYRPRRRAPDATISLHACPALCLMPDHFHLLWVGVSPESDQRKAAKFFREHVNRLLQEQGLKTHVFSYGADANAKASAPGYFLQLQGYDHVLTAEERQHDAFARVAFYIFENPVRKGLVKFWSEYPFSGAQVVGYRKLDVRDPDYWETYWKIYERLVEDKRAGG